MPSLKEIIAEINARHTQEIIEALAGASFQDLQDVVGGLRGKPGGPKTPREPRANKPPAKTSHAVEMDAATIVAHLKESGPLRSEELRRVLNLSRQETANALALALDWNLMGKKGEKRATTYFAKKQRGSKPQLTVGDRMRVAAVFGK